MRYRKISNDPLGRSLINFTWCYWDNAFTEEELNSIENYVGSSSLKEGETFSNSSEKFDRKSKVNFFNPDENNKWIFDRFNFVIEDINENFFNFDLNGYENFQYSEYNSKNFGTYNFHMDTYFGREISLDYIETRKLSVVMLLNTPDKDFTGGEFMVNTSLENNAEKIDLKRGRIILFPSFILHKVNPVTSGIRKSIVIWVTGPKFK